MFGNLMGDMEARQAEMKKKLATVFVSAEAGDGAVKIEANANREITNVSIDKSKLQSDDMEELEDLLLIAINRVLEDAAEKEATAAQDLMKQMLPPGMGDLFGGGI